VEALFHKTVWISSCFELSEKCTPLFISNISPMRDEEWSTATGKYGIRVPHLICPVGPETTQLLPFSAMQ